jgi:steroid delta-isomerase-like uncharacterized protein
VGQVAVVVAGLLEVGPEKRKEGVNAVTAEENKAFVRRQIEETWNKGNLDFVDEGFTSDYVKHDPLSPEEIRGPEGFKRNVAETRSAFPDFRIEIVEQLAEGDLVATRYVVCGTQEGELEGIPPTGNRIQVAGTGVDRFSEGKIAESWEMYDTLGMMQQLGVIPSPERPTQA